MIEQCNNMYNKNANKKRHSNNIAIILTIIGLGVATTAGGAVYATLITDEDLTVNGNVILLSSGETYSSTLSFSQDPGGDAIIWIPDFGTGTGIQFKSGAIGGDGDRITFRSNGDVGIGTTSPSEKLDVRGNAIADSWLTHSSQKWKKDITPLDDTLDKVTQIQGVTYQWRADEFPEMSFDDTTTQIGFIAEELELIYPELVYTTGNGDKSIDYGKLTPILLEAIKEQQNILEDLKTVICPDNPELSACQ